MKVLFTLLIFYIFGNVVWRTILRKGAYPSSVNWYLKWTHALILVFLLTYALGAFGELFWLIRFRPNIRDDLFVGIARIITIITGLALPFICDRMVKRQRQALRWYFTVWPICFLTANYVRFATLGDKYPTWLIEFVAAMSFCLLLATVIFYMIDSVQRALFIS